MPLALTTENGAVLPRPAARRAVVPSSVLAVVILVAAETMFFAGLASAFLIGKAGAGPLLWPPLDQPRLPLATTAVNTLVLLGSGALLAGAQRALGRGAAETARRLMTLALLAGAAFVLFQGSEWVRLVGYGLTLTSSTYASFFYLLVGAHALHVVGGLLALGWLTREARAGRASPDHVTAVGIFWYFVVGLWPLLYVMVYVS